MTRIASVATTVLLLLGSAERAALADPIPTSFASQPMFESVKRRIVRSAISGLFAATIIPTVAVASPAVLACAASPLAAVPAAHQTRGSVTTRAGRLIGYEAEAGWIRVGGDEAVDRGLTGDGAASAAVPSGSRAALMSYVAYFAQGKPTTTRPILFLWEGGPGTATTSMVTASFGPVLRTDNAQVGPVVHSNPDTLLDAADLVFVDAPGTGFGRLEGCAPARSFYGVDVDAAAFRRFIQRFLATHNRLGSPLYLFGESYGTLRAAVVAHRLEDVGVRVSGIVLSSQMLALDAWSDGALANPGTENAFFLSLPSFAATAWVHGRVPHTGDLETWLRGVERFSILEYAPALLQGSDLAPERKRALAERLAAYTGLSPQTWMEADLRIEGTRFRTLLEADQGRLVGREDTRVDGPTPTTKGTAVDNDPALAVAHASRKAALTSYIRGTLQFGDRTFTPYIDGPDIRWDMDHVSDPNAFPDTYVNTGPDLVAAMTANSKLQVFLAGGYFDLATPYLGGPYLFKHLQLPEALRTNLAWHEYPAGHDPYEDARVRQDMHDRISALIQ